MKTEDRLNALEVALNNETRERRFYLKNAERTKHPLGKAMFLQIADEELEHYERLKQLYENWQKEEKWPETLPFKVAETAIQEVMKDMLRQIDELPVGDDDDLDAIRTAIDFEAKGMAYYEKLRDAVSDPKEQDFFDLLSRMERQHYLSLKDTEEYLINPEAWNRAKEHLILDGA
jgi:rubrerythrin